MKYFYFHEHSREAAWLPDQDFAVFKPEDGFFAITDGITRPGKKDDLLYPQEWYGAEAARIFAESSYSKYSSQPKMEINSLLKYANSELGLFNTKNGFNYKNPIEKYWMGECVGVITTIDNDILRYGLMEDCYINVLGKGDYDKDKTSLKYQLLKAFKYARSQVDSEDDAEFEKVWCGQLENNPNAKDKDGDLVGWGCLNGDPRAEQFWQVGEVKLEKGDVIWLFSDGMIPVLENRDLANWIIQNCSDKNYNSQVELSKKIDEYNKTSNKKVSSEKTFVQIIFE